MTNNQQVSVFNPNALVGSIKELRDDLTRLESRLAFSLPPHIRPQRFAAVVIASVNKNPKLLRCKKQSFFNACMLAANDGLLPDGRQGAIVPYGEDEDGNKGAGDCSWLPMVFGIRQKVLNSGLVAEWDVEVVHEGDEFDFSKGDDPYIRHKPAMRGGRTRKITHAYSIASFKDGSKSREVMTIEEVEDVRKKSSTARKGPWSEPVFYPEMVRKTVAKLHAKRLPQSSDLDILLRREDEAFLSGQRERALGREDVKPPPSVAAVLDTFADEPQPEEKGAVPDKPVAQGAGGEQEREAAAASSPAAAVDPIEKAYHAGQEAKAAGHARKAMPPELRVEARQAEAQAWQRGYDEGAKTLV
jgi:recombination protein RecT